MDPQTALGELLIGIDHVGVAVADLDEGIEFWTRTVGLRLVHREVNQEQQVAEAMLRAGDGTTELQLLAPTDATSTIAKFLDRRGPGLQQLALTVRDVVAAAERLAEHGITVLHDQPRTGTAGSLINFVHPRDTAGVLLELVQPSDSAVAARPVS